jgi:hypothetical protein
MNNLNKERKKEIDENHMCILEHKYIIEHHIHTTWTLQNIAQNII